MTPLGYIYYIIEDLKGTEQNSTMSDEELRAP